jgi:hypothetical protein
MEMAPGGTVVNQTDRNEELAPAPRGVVLPLFPNAPAAAVDSGGARAAHAARVFAAPVAVLAGIALVRVTRHVTVATLTRDPMALLDRSPMTGLLSNLGGLVWMGAVTVCLFGAGRLRRRGRGEAAAFFAGFGALSVVLLADDMFMIHDYYAPDYLHLGERTIFAAYGLIAAALLVRFRDFIRSGPWGILAVAMVCFAASMAVDAGLIVQSDWHHLAEDGAKWLGICGWFGFFWLRLGRELDGTEPDGVRPGGAPRA